jgi:uracil-DNA glycosylase
MTIDQYFGRWMQVIDREQLNKVYRFIQTKPVIYPSKKDIFKAFRLCNYDDCRLIIVGQDPYSNGRATGLAFANDASISPNNLSPSLEKVKDSLIRDIISWKSITFDQTLESWAEQGVLLLNSSLSVEPNRPLSHSLYWRPFMTSLFKNLSEKRTGMVYVLMGTSACEMQRYINPCSNHILTCDHPAYYCRKEKPMPNILEKANDIIYGLNGDRLKFISYGREDSECT